MNIIKSKSIGFCRGVSLAIDKMNESIEWGNKQHLPVYSLGNLIHNERVIDNFKLKGVVVLEENDLESYKPGLIVLRAHGVKETVFRKLLNLGYIVVDATCPIVVKEQNLIKEIDSSYHVVVIGKENHPEAQFLYSAETGHSRTLVTCLSDVDKIRTSKPLFVVIQSTFPETKAKAIYDEIYKIKKPPQEVIIANSPCSSTRIRREAIEELSKVSDCIVIIGGKNSSNTEGLRLFALKYNKPVFLINSKDEIPLDVYDFENIGVATGTSTPQFIIDEVINTLKENVSET